jgi:hypothetical protein
VTTKFREEFKWHRKQTAGVLVVAYAVQCNTDIRANPPQWAFANVIDVSGSQGRPF